MPISFPYDVNPIDCFNYVREHPSEFEAILFDTCPRDYRPGEVMGYEDGPRYVIIDWPRDSDGITECVVLHYPDGGLSTRSFSDPDVTVPILGVIPGTPADTEAR